MNTVEKELAVGRIATSALGKMAREIANALKPKSRRGVSEEVAEKRATKILENVLGILKKTQKEIRNTMDGKSASKSAVEVDPETGEAISSEVTISETIDHDGRIS